MKTTLEPRTCLLLILSLALACLLGVEPDPAHAGTVTVDTASDEQDNHCDDGDCSLRDAINTAAADDIIVFAPALSGQTIPLTIGQLDIHQDLTIDGSSLASHVKISGNNTYRVLAMHGNIIVTLRSLDIIKGKTPADGFGGGGIYNESDLTVTGCNVTQNTTPDNGGGIRNTGTATVEDSAVSNNQAGYGGGIRNEGDLTVRDSTLSDNTADFGGGIDNYAGSMKMRNTLLEHNSATHYGGGLTTGTAAAVEDSIFSENSAESGGGIESHEASATLTLTRCLLTGNTAHIPAGYGAALNNNEASVEVNDSAFEANTADRSGGGIYNGLSGTVTINDSTFTGNTASSAADGYGGAVGNSGTLILQRSALSSNTARINGGAIENWDGDLTAADCVFASNQAEHGGAINNNANGTLTAHGCTFGSNVASGTGGGIFNDNDSDATLENSTLSANTATYEGGGIYNISGSVTLNNATFDSNSAGSGGGINNKATLNYRNTIIANSPSGADCLSNDAGIGENVNNLVGDGSCLAAFSGDPDLAPLADNGGPTETHALLPGSPAIDAGDNATCLTLDQRGAARPADGDEAGSGAADCDIGAFESGVIQCGILIAPEPIDYQFPDGVTLHVTDDNGELDCLRVTAFPTDHPSAPVLLQTGNYWQIRALAGDQIAPAAGAFVDLTLPYSAADDNDSACRYSGSGWDCAATGYIPLTSVTRTDVDKLSDWTVSSDSCTANATPEPGISLAGGHRRSVLLSWADDPANASGYQVHRSKTPHFTPDTGTLQAARPAGSTSYIDVGAAGTAGARYFYIVRGLSNCGAPSDYDRRLGMFTFGLVPGQ
jgi:CSLREA domain-containing protein